MNRITRSTRKQPARWIALLTEPRPGKSGIVRLTIRKSKNVVETTRYLLDVLCSDYGQGAFRLQKLGEDHDTYDVLLDANGLSTCDCKGHSRWGRCKHVEGLQALFGKGLLPIPMAEREEVEQLEPVA